MWFARARHSRQSEPGSTRRLEILIGSNPNGISSPSRPQIIRAGTIRRALRQHRARAGTAVRRSDACACGVVARHGVGYDSVVAADARAGVLVTNTPTAMPRPVATTALTFVLALAGKLFLKDRLTRSGRWHERMDNMGLGLSGRTLGVIGAGGIGKELLRMARVFDLKLLATDPVANDVELGYIGARKVDLDTPMRESDFVVICCLLNEHTRHLIGAEALAKMKPTSYLINVARGPIVDEKALIDVLQKRCIAGAALDVFEQEPVDPANPLLTMDDVIVTPHSLCWTDECFHNMASTGLRSIVDALNGRIPEFLVNRAVLQHPRAAEWFRPGGE